MNSTSSSTTPGFWSRLAAPPESRELASRVVGVGLLVGAMFTAWFTPFDHSNPVWGDVFLYVIAAVFGVIGAFMRRRPRSVPAWALTVAPFAGLALLSFSNLITRDSSSNAHLVALWPALWSALFLNRTQIVVTLSFLGTTNFAVLMVIALPSQALMYTISLTVTAAVISWTVASLRAEKAGALRHADTLAHHDALTGLVNRRGLMRALGHVGSDVSITLVTLDLDRFKEINDARGHLEADDLLTRTAAVLTGEVRAVDTVARTGGDEFVLLLPGCPVPEAVRIVERIRGGVREATGMTVSAGVAGSSLPDAPDDLMRRSDDALYAAKRSGRDRVVVGDDDPPLPQAL